MLVRKLPIRLPRKVTAYFLLFGLAALVWLTLGTVYVSHAVSDDRSASTSIRAIGRASDRLVLAYLRDPQTDLAVLLADIRSYSGALYCAVASPTGEFLAHTNKDLAKQPATEVGAIAQRWGEVERIDHENGEGVLIHEYRCPLKAGTTEIGTLRMGMPQPGGWNYLGTTAPFAPWAILGPAGCLVVGAILLNRLVRPVADIEQQLHQLAMSPSLESCEWHEVPSVGAAAIGWNRVVRQRLSGEGRPSLKDRVRESLDRARQGRFDAVLNSIPEGLATTDATGRLTYANTPLSVLLGLMDTSGRTPALNEGGEPVSLVERLRMRWHLSETDPLIQEENRDHAVVTELVREEDGQRRILRVARHPICANSGTGQETHVWLLRDVTQQRLAEEMRDQFVDTATHELRTPLANIKAYAETLALADVIDVEQQKQFLNTINSEATRLARFVDDLLSVSSMELGSLSLNKQVTDLARMLNEVLVKIRPQVEEKHLAFDVALPEKLPEPELDKDKIAAVLVNLLGNAIKYTPEGGRVTFRVNITDQQIDMSVEDTGVGIAPEELPKVFEKFFRSADPRVQEQTGTGLGLALANEVVRLHGGRITVESEINKGSTFSVLLPRA